MERLLASAIPSLFVWVLMFVACSNYGYPYSRVDEVRRPAILSTVGAQKFDGHWRLWNLPVHNWLVRHVFFPCLNLGLNKMAATLVVFVSAALHKSWSRDRATSRVLRLRGHDGPGATHSVDERLTGACPLGYRLLGRLRRGPMAPMLTSTTRCRVFGFGAVLGGGCNPVRDVRSSQGRDSDPA